MRARARTPPTTMPAMAPVERDVDEEEELGGEGVGLLLLVELGLLWRVD